MPKPGFSLFFGKRPECSGCDHIVKIVIDEDRSCIDFHSSLDVALVAFDADEGLVILDPIFDIVLLAEFVHELSHGMSRLRDSLALSERRVHDDVNALVHAITSCSSVCSRNI